MMEGVFNKKKQLENIEYSLGTFNNPSSKAYIMVTTIHAFYCIHLVPKVLVIFYVNRERRKFHPFGGLRRLHAVLDTAKVQIYLFIMK